MKEAVTIGAHHIQREGDVIWIVEQGLNSLAEMQAMFALLRRWQAEQLAKRDWNITLHTPAAPFKSPSAGALQGVTSASKLGRTTEPYIVR